MALIWEVARASQVEPGYSSEMGPWAGLRRRWGLAGCGWIQHRKEISVAFTEGFLYIRRGAEHLVCVTW